MTTRQRLIPGAGFGHSPVHLSSTTTKQRLVGAAGVHMTEKNTSGGGVVAANNAANLAMMMGMGQ